MTDCNLEVQAKIYPVFLKAPLLENFILTTGKERKILETVSCHVKETENTHNQLEKPRRVGSYLTWRSGLQFSVQ